MPAQAAVDRHIADAMAAVFSPLLDALEDEFDFPAEVVGFWNALNHGVDLGAFAGSGLGLSRRLVHHVEQGLEGVAEMCAAVEGGSCKVTRLGEISGGLESKVVEVTPRAIGRQDDLGVIREIELQCVSHLSISPDAV